MADKFLVSHLVVLNIQILEVVAVQRLPTALQLAALMGHRKDYAELVHPSVAINILYIIFVIFLLIQCVPI